MKKSVHTIVLHLFPDLEALLMLWLIYRFDRIRERFGVVSGKLCFKTIPSGPLRREDWEKEEALPSGTPLRARDIELHGYLFIDCGGGAPLDQHGLDMNEERNLVASIDLLMEATHLLRQEPYLQSLVELVSLHDREGVSVAKIRNRDRKNSPTPHTPRDLHMLILGWNLSRPVEEVVELVVLALDGVLALLLREAERIVDAGSDDRLMRVTEMNLFTLGKILEGVQLHTEENLGVDASKFLKDAERALQVVEHEWYRAANDFRDTAKVWDFDATVTKRNASGALEQARIKMVAGISDSERFGAYCRFHRSGKDDHGADVVIQFASNFGKFVVSTRGGIDLASVSAALRAAEMVCGNAVPVDPLSALERPGQFRIQKDGEVVQSFYFPEFRTAVGNNFRTNPYLPPSVLPRMEIVEIVRRTLEGSPPVSESNRPCNWGRPTCRRSCPFYDAQLRGCQWFRAQEQVVAR